MKIKTTSTAEQKSTADAVLTSKPEPLPEVKRATTSSCNGTDIVLPVGPISQLEFTVNVDTGTDTCDAVTFTLTPAGMASLSQAKHLLLGVRVVDATPDNRPRETDVMLIFPADTIQKNARSIPAQTEI